MTTSGAYILALVLAAGLLLGGIFLVRNPERAAKAFSFGQVQNQFGVKFFRAVGWFYVCGGVIGILMVAFALGLNYFRLRHP